MPPDASAVGQQVVNLGLPEGALIILMQRESERFVPCGSTVIEAGDTLLLLTTDDLVESVRARFLETGEGKDAARSG
ncbi:MAG TPA: TrkA C-terminal domain-containing protein [Methanoculleus sp.]|nr:TrkA C-terminal domain-containing protein [Syntrophorhabdaceae bacterium]HPZ32338.1 TrkA C-terminal domain-containing protein [Methanoculleus sp.]